MAAKRNQDAVLVERAMNLFDARYGLGQAHVKVDGVLSNQDFRTFHWFLWILGISDAQLERVTGWRNLGGWSLLELTTWLAHSSVYLDHHPGGKVRHKENLAKLRNSGTAGHISNRGVNFIIEFEGYSATWYDDGTGTMTIGYGHTTESLHGYRAPLTRLEAVGLLHADLVPYENAVKQVVQPSHLNGGRIDGLTSFAYNLGPGMLTDGGRNSIASRTNRGDYAGAANEILAFDKAVIGGVLQSLPGLARRRRGERSLYLS